VFLKVGLLVAERLLYTPSIGVCTLVGWMLASTAAGSQQRHATVRVLLVAVAAVCVWRCQVRNVEWANADSLYAAALQVCPESARINNNIGTRYASFYELRLTMSGCSRLIDR
jgi:hypothetical protein